MATYGDTASEYPYKHVQKKRKQKYSLITKIVDFANLPVTTATPQGATSFTTAWAAGDVLQAVRIRSGNTVLAVQVDVLTASPDTGDSFDVGYGSDTDRWGRYNLYGTDAVPNTGVRNDATQNSQVPAEFFEPVYFSSNDTIDVVINKAAIQGKFRLIVHILEDDR